MLVLKAASDSLLRISSEAVPQFCPSIANTSTSYSYYAFIYSNYFNTVAIQLSLVFNGPGI